MSKDFQHNKTKYIFVTGGVTSSVGKGITVASIGRLLKFRSKSISIIKLDPYLNVDPGTMSPYQHGEVFVTKDGGETDLDLGHYERFVDQELTKSSNITAGQIYLSLIQKERNGDFLGGTIQIVPHVTTEIKNKITGLARESEADFIVVEVGGTVGDIEGLPFLEAIRQMRNDVGRDNVLYVHVTLVPEMSTTGEIKTKPTQHSVKELRAIGIQPDVIVFRSDRELDGELGDEVKRKIALFCDVSNDAVIHLPTVNNIYDIPIYMEEVGLGRIIENYLHVDSADLDTVQWEKLLKRMKEPQESIKIAIVGKYVALPDSYMSVKESIIHASIPAKKTIEIEWVNSEDVTLDNVRSLLGDVNGIIVPGGFGERGIEGMIVTAKFARENNVPYFGLCLGMQIMVIEFARNVLGFEGANSTEFDSENKFPVIDIMPNQINVDQKGGTMRLGEYRCNLLKNTKAGNSYLMDSVNERHRHRYELNNKFRNDFEQLGLIASGVSPDNSLVEICEVKSHLFMLGVQFHPEFRSRPNRPHPLFVEFIKNAGTVYPEGKQPPLLKEA